jgi:hypothetical protein
LRVVAREFSDVKDMSTEAEESKFLGAVIRQLLEKTEDFLYAAVQQYAECLNL